MTAIRKLNKLNAWLSAVMAAVTVMVAGCSPAETYRTDSGVVWATTYHLTYRADRDLSDSVVAVMRRVEMSLSPFQPRSLISAINRGDTCRADSLIIKVFDASVAVNRASGGVFDPTVGPLVELWGFGKDRDVISEPSDSLIADALRLVGIGDCSIAETGLVSKKHPQTMFNFSAITKGLGCDEVGAMLRRNGVTDYMVEIGGEIALSGLNRSGEPWRIMIDAPVDDASGSHVGLLAVSVTGCGMATSGNYRNYRDTPSGRIGHTISPQTGRPAPRRVLSATVIAPDCMMADALATACMAMQPDSAMAMITSIEGAEAMLVMPPAEGDSTTFRIAATPGFPSASR